jgi:acetate CoA/acetoacetate CoA-transferase beta subunit
MQHTQKGTHKILKECRLPYTAVGVVDMIITEMGVMEITGDGIVLKEVNAGYTIEDVQNATEAELIISPGLNYDGQED